VIGYFIIYDFSILGRKKLLLT